MMALQLTVSATPDVMAMGWALVRALERLAPGWTPTVEQMAGASPPTGVRPPDRPPTRRRDMSPEERRLHDNALAAAKMRRLRAKKKGEQGASPALPVVDSPESYSDDQHYTTTEATSRGSDGASRHVSDVVTPVVTPVVTIETARNGKGGGKGGGFGLFASREPTTAPHLPPKAPPQGPVTTLRAARAEAAHSARERRGAKPGPVTTPSVVTRNATGSGEGESALTPEGGVASGHSLRDAMCALYAEVFPGSRYDWRDEDDRASRGLLVRASSDTDEVLLRWRIALRTRFPRCRSVRKLLSEWNEYGAPDLEPDAPHHAPAPQLDVGGSTAQGCECALHGCGDSTRTGPTLGQPLCAFHAMAMMDALGPSAGNESAAAWVLGQNAEEVP